MARLTMLAVCLGVGALSGCTSLEERQRANGNYDYVEAEEKVPYKVPSDVDTPYLKSDYDIPPIGENAPKELVGDKVTVTSPSLVLPLVSGSHVEEGLKEATVWFDQIDDSEALDTTIWNSVISFLDDRDIGVVNFDKEAQILVTDWMIIEPDKDNGWFNWTTTERSIGRRFEFNLEIKPHGRTAKLKVQLRDYLETIGDDVIADINFEQSRRNEVEILNQVISHYEKQVRLEDVKRIRQIRSGFGLEMGFNPDGNPAYVVDGQYDLVWPRLLLVLRKLGFNVKDLDKSTGLLFVNYGGAESSWWDNLFSKSDGQLDLEKTDYRIQVKKQGPKTSFTLLSEESEPFEVKKVTDLFPAFKEAMGTENLDI
ncbi:outer membrane protein assembly factor BamC [Aliiglaciecola lipolytica]|uniref:outer membrane protein assembly factor BamC n=1 Tax=Aliiglaciecola lipolytica TaxID=477689 RepID=UPI001C0A14B1|nr:outer membrane protein assembly factor BamC [Aliiglaciecola lipolytica]MBU2877141.1 outer membrane protein assembly factor BamC [Aliiglaciecola lipolytica]